MFAEKFSLLNSQENSEEINWSSSSSELGNTSCGDKTPCAVNRRLPHKRKRKKKTQNTSNLDIKIVPAWNNKSGLRFSGKRVCKSPILSSSRCSPTKNFVITSPVLGKSLHHKSPILTLKYSSPTSGKARKKLFSERKNHDSGNTSANIAKCCNIDHKECRKGHNTSTIAESLQNYYLQDNGRDKQSIDQSVNTSADSESICSDKLMIVKKFFENNFSSDTTSQHISDTPTPNNSTKSDEVDILSCKTQSVSGNCDVKQESLPDSTSTKKNRYKKGGLAYRLNMLLKKHNANISLWQHERFLAKNSNFIIPRGEHTVFHIQKTFFKYDNYVLEVCDMNNIKYLILINNMYVTSNIIDNSVIKLYEPFKILDFNQYCNLIINVCKFEIVDIKINE